MARAHIGRNGPILATNAVVLLLVIAMGVLIVILRPVHSDGSLPDTGRFYQEYQDDINRLAQTLFVRLDGGEDLTNDDEASWDLVPSRLKAQLLDVVMVNEDTVFLRCGSLYHLSNGIVITRNHHALEKQYPETGLDGGISHYYIAENTYGFFSSSSLE